MKSYYEELKKTMNSLFEKKEYIKLDELIKEEKGLPYIPPEFKKFLDEIDEKCRIKKHKSESKINTLSFDEVYRLLTIPDSKIDKEELLDYLKIYNLKIHLDRVKDLLQYDNYVVSTPLKIKILFILKSQNIKGNFVVKYNKTSFNTINLEKIDYIENNPKFKKINDKLELILGKNIVVIEVAKKIVETILINSLLLGIDMDLDDIAMYSSILAARKLDQKIVLRNIMNKYKIFMEDPKIKSGMKRVLSILYYGDK